jgi:hypothetical protein
MLSARPAGCRRARGARGTLPCIVSAPDRPDPVQMRILARLSPERKLEVARRLREDALALKEAWLRQSHPGEDDAAIRRRLRAWQLHGSARLD